MIYGEKNIRSVMHGHRCQKLTRLIASLLDLLINGTGKDIFTLKRVLAVSTCREY